MFPKELEKLYSENYEELVVMARYHSESSDEVDELLQTAMLKACYYFNSFDGKNFTGWIFKILRNAKLESERVKIPNCNEKDLSYIFDSRNLENTVIEKETEVIVRKAINQLKPIYREVIELSDILELSEEVVARKLGIPKGTVKSRLHTARVTLKNLIGGMM